MDSETARALGKSMTPKKVAAARKNAEIARSRRREPSPCTCGQTGGKHANRCPVYWREMKRRWRLKNVGK